MSNCPNRDIIIATCLVFFWPSSSLGPARAEEPDSPKRNPDALRLLADIRNAYQALPAYADRGEVAFKGTRTAPQGKHSIGSIEGTSMLRMMFLRPNRFVIQTDKHHLVSDGDQLIIADQPSKLYISKPAPKKTIDTHTITDGLDFMTSAELLLDIPLTFALETAAGLVRGQDPEHVLLDQDAKVRMEPDRVVDGEKAKSLLISEEDGKQRSDLRLIVDPNSKLVKRIEFTGIDDETTCTIVWTVRPISTAVPEANAFTYRPPPGFTKPKGNTLKAAAIMAVAKSIGRGFVTGLMRRSDAKRP